MLTKQLACELAKYKIPTPVERELLKLWADEKMKIFTDKITLGESGETF
jgi:hypothetical protein